MCSRYEMRASGEEVLKSFLLKAPPLIPNTPEIRPTDQAMVISTDQNGEAHPCLMGWGLHGEWSNKPIINARAETLAQKKTFKPLLQTRCLVPATGYFEWRKSGLEKLKNRISVENTAVFAFAGLSDGQHFTIITCPPSPTIAHIHDRMPVILKNNALAPWIDPVRAFEEVANFLTPYEERPLNVAEDTPPEPPQADLFG